MSHEVESMFSVLETPWHKLGVVLPEAPSIGDAIRYAGLDWEVGLKPLVKTARGAIAWLSARGYDAHGVKVAVYLTPRQTEMTDMLTKTQAVHALALATLRASEMTSGMKSSAESCVADGMAVLKRVEKIGSVDPRFYTIVAGCAMRSLKYSVGIFSPDWAAVASMVRSSAAVST